MSAKDTNRAGLNSCLEYLREDDVLHVHSIDRLARNLADLQNLVSSLIEKGVTVRFHKENLIFNGNDEAFSRLMLQMLGTFSEFERNLIRERQWEGIELAKRNGKRLGRKPALKKNDIHEIRLMVAAGISKNEIATKFNVSRQTIYNLIN